MALLITPSCVSKPALGAEVVAAPTAAAGRRVGGKRRSGGAARAVRQGDGSHRRDVVVVHERQRGEVVGDRREEGAVTSVTSIEGRPSQRSEVAAKPTTSSVVNGRIESDVRAAFGRLADGDQHFVQRQLQLVNVLLDGAAGGRSGRPVDGRADRSAGAEAEVEEVSCAGIVFAEATVPCA